MRNKIGVIGHFGGGYDFYDGQTIKTKELADLLKTKGNFDLQCVDTYLNKTSKVKLLVHTVRCLLRCKDVFLLVSDNGMRFYLPFLYWFTKLKRVRIYHYVIGSELLSLAEENSNIVKYLNALKVNWFEYESGTQYLRKLGVKNATTLPNFKRIQPNDDIRPAECTDGTFQFCTFSRVMEEKGITDAIHAVRSINAEHDRVAAKLDIYGPVDKEYEEAFSKLLAENSDCVAYKGIVDSRSSVETLKGYFALLFPTKWPGEGVPGTVIDAFAAGVPVIASDWNANGEMIDHPRTGLLYPNAEMSTLKEAVDWAMQNESAVQQMRWECRKEFTKYEADTVLQVMLHEMQHE